MLAYSGSNIYSFTDVTVISVGSEAIKTQPEILIAWIFFRARSTHSLYGGLMNPGPE